MALRCSFCLRQRVLGQIHSIPFHSICLFHFPFPFHCLSDPAISFPFIQFIPFLSIVGYCWCGNMGARERAQFGNVVSLRSYQKCRLSRVAVAMPRCNHGRRRRDDCCAIVIVTVRSAQGSSDIHPAGGAMLARGSITWSPEGHDSHCAAVELGECVDAFAHCCVPSSAPAFVLLCFGRIRADVAPLQPSTDHRSFTKPAEPSP